MISISAPFQWSRTADARWANDCKSGEADLQGRGGKIFAKYRGSIFSKYFGGQYLQNILGSIFAKYIGGQYEDNLVRGGETFVKYMGGQSSIFAKKNMKPISKGEEVKPPDFISQSDYFDFHDQLKGDNPIPGPKRWQRHPSAGNSTKLVSGKVQWKTNKKLVRE